MSAEITTEDLEYAKKYIQSNPTKITRFENVIVGHHNTQLTFTKKDNNHINVTVSQKAYQRHKIAFYYLAPDTITVPIVELKKYAELEKQEKQAEIDAKIKTVSKILHQHPALIDETLDYLNKQAAKENVLKDTMSKQKNAGYQHKARH
jgi:hypothetical protein